VDGVATLVYLYGPPASGKLTVATALAARTGFRLFHNHLTVNAVRSVFDFGSPAFSSVLHRMRLDVFSTAMQAGVDVIFTNNSAWSGVDPRDRFTAFVDEVERAVSAGGGGGVVRFVQVTAPDDVLAARVDAASRRDHGKLTDPVRLRELLASLDRTPLHADDLLVDTSVLSPEDAAERIASTL
jgi:chloramphenicol 3-O-phosphotransferase